MLQPVQRLQSMTNGSEIVKDTIGRNSSQRRNHEVKRVKGPLLLQLSRPGSTELSAVSITMSGMLEPDCSVVFNVFVGTNMVPSEDRDMDWRRDWRSKPTIRERPSLD